MKIRVFISLIENVIKTILIKDAPLCFSCIKIFLEV
jgi:hypothetical protein